MAEREHDNPDRRFVSVEGAAARVDVSISTVRRWLKDKRLTAYRPAGARILIAVEQLDALVMAATS